MLACVGLILKQFQFMAILFLWLLVLSIGYHFVMIIPVWVCFFLFREKEPTFRFLELSKIALKCYCCRRLRLSSFYSAGRGGPKNREDWAAPRWRGCGVFCILDLEKGCSPLELWQCSLLMIFFCLFPQGWFINKMYCFCQVCATGLSGVSGMKDANWVKCMRGE